MDDQPTVPSPDLSALDIQEPALDSALVAKVRELATEAARGEVDLATLTHTIAERVVESVWRRLDRRGLAGFPPRILKDLLDQLPTRVPEPPPSHANPAPVQAQDQEQDRALESEAVAEKVTQSVWGRMSRLGLAGFPPRVKLELESFASEAATKALDAIRQRLDTAEGRLRSVEAGMVTNQPSKDRHFLALVREVKALKERLDAAAPAPASDS
jgi:hypothetical protein